MWYDAITQVWENLSIFESSRGDDADSWLRDFWNLVIMYKKNGLVRRIIVWQQSRLVCKIAMPWAGWGNPAAAWRQ